MSVWKEIAVANVLLSMILALWSVLDVYRRPPAMSVMKWVWPLTFLWGGLFALGMYLWFGRSPARGWRQADHSAHGHPHAGDHGQGQRPFWQSVALGATHCGAGCTLADIVTESAIFLLGLRLVVWGHAVFGNWMADYGMALGIGVVFQYAAQAPMSRVSGATVWLRSFQSDVLSLTSWQLGMYGWMAVCMFVLFRDGEMQPDHWIFWWMMQVAMFCGFLTAFPTNWVLIRMGIKEAM